MALVLALEPDLRQATVLKRVIREHVGAELTVVDSRDGAIAAIGERMPDVILLTALLSPRDEEELFSRLRAMAGSEHVQTHTIPQLASAATPAPEEPGGKSVFGKLRRRKADPTPIPGCDPELFAEEVVTFLQRAAELKIKRSTLRTRDEDDQPMRPAEPRPHASNVESDVEPAAAPAETGSSWSSPFEWRPTPDTRSMAPAVPVAVGEPQAQEDVEGKIARASLRDADMAAERIRVETEREAERLRMESERAVEREKERARVEAEREKERLRVEAEREKERLRVDAERQAEKLRVDAERQKLEAQRHKEAAEREAERVRAEAERHKLEADAAAARRREAERLREEAAKEKERLRKQAEQEKERLRKESDERRIAAEREAARIRVEAEREKERLRLEAERQKVEAERRKFEAEAAAARQREAERLRQEAEREAERLRLQAEREKKDAERLKKDAEQQKLQAQREAERLRTEAERQKIEAERQKSEAERQKKEAEAAAARQREAERRRLEAEREADRLREEALREAERLRAQAEEDAERARAEEAIAAAKTQEEARERRDAEKARKRSADRARKHKEAVHDAFAEFRDDPVEHPRGAIRLVPLSIWARVEKPQAAAPDTDRDELRELMKGLSIPLHVAGVAYARGCRIRRVRVPAAAPAKGKGHKGPVILSRRALDEARSGGGTP